MEEKSMEFSNRTKAEIERNRFAAQTGALVQLSAPAYREILAAAIQRLALLPPHGSAPQESHEEPSGE